MKYAANFTNLYNQSYGQIVPGITVFDLVSSTECSITNAAIGLTREEAAQMVNTMLDGLQIDKTDYETLINAFMGVFAKVDFEALANQCIESTKLKINPDEAITLQIRHVQDRTKKTVALSQLVVYNPQEGIAQVPLPQTVDDVIPSYCKRIFLLNRKNGRKNSLSIS